MMYEMYVQTRNVYIPNKDGVSIFIRTDRKGLLSGKSEGQAESVDIAEGGWPQGNCGTQASKGMSLRDVRFSSSYEEVINSSKIYRNSLLVHKNRLSFFLYVFDPTLVSVQRGGRKFPCFSPSLHDGTCSWVELAGHSPPGLHY